ncbi:nitrilase-related carbon-nitrogen hydrolase [Luteithermobacter gelatinilyticus]|uniref:nitrilase-related carbon-nitrogen hydrolase n=1 Tax=Luteithermobacter gelatinilyticus TaxID=2582913 RepID=UPI0011064A7A|nr:nitrilase-related carbon-nitrogen hydrolase [Luteithermobacter gelatinilyticus]
MTEDQKLLGPTYYAIALQTAVDAVNGCQSQAEAAEVITRTLNRLAREIPASKRFIGPDTKLFVLPEYFLTAYPLGDTIEGWAQKASIRTDGPEYEALGRIAQDNKIYLAGNAYELDDHFPGLYFQSCFIIAPSGDVILRYRRLNSMFAPTPHDVWDKYLDLYGLEGVFPVARTEIGALAAIASEEILYPEIVRCLAMRGAEIFLHSTGEMGNMTNTPKNIARKARALENMAYVISANAGTIRGHELPCAATDGRSALIDYQGQTLAESGWGETMTAYGAIDLNALRRYRRRPGMGNFLARQRFELFAESYATLGSQKANTLLNDKGHHRIPDRTHFMTTQTDCIARLARKNVI